MIELSYIPIFRIGMAISSPPIVIRRRPTQAFLMKVDLVSEQWRMNSVGKYSDVGHILLISCLQPQEAEDLVHRCLLVLAVGLLATIVVSGGL